MGIFKETKLRSITKAISWRLIASLATFLLVYLVTGQLKLSLGIGILDIFLKMILYFFHERVWNLINWGKTIFK